MRTPDEGKLEKIRKCMRSHPEGTYVSEIARETGLTKSTVSWLVSQRMKSEVQVVKLGKGGLFKIMRLKK